VRELSQSTLSRSQEAEAPATRRAPCLFLVAECDRPRAAPSRHDLSGVDEVVIGRGERRSRRELVDGLLRRTITAPDRWMSTTQCRLQRKLDYWQLEDAGSRNGTFVNGVRTENAVLRDGALLELGHTFFFYRAGAPIGDDARGDVDASALAPPAPGLATLHPGFARELSLLSRVAAAELPVLLLGESGAGKEVVARALHDLSGRAGPFVAVNCGALTETLRESELFGHRKGAFTGASQDHAGLVRSADGGTLFLDEIGDLPLSSQVTLLRVLQERQVTPVGTTRPVFVDLRVCAATNRDLAAMVAKETFRVDLFARLSGFTLVLPPLRERREDIGLIVSALLGRLAPARADALRFTPAAMRALLSHEWPLNVRELENGLARAIATCDGDLVRLEHLPPLLAAAALPPTDDDDHDHDDAPPRDDHDEPTGDTTGDPRERLLALMTDHAGNISAVARAMKTSRTQVRRWLQRCQLDRDLFLP